MNSLSVVLCCIAAVKIASVSGSDYCSSSLCREGATHIACAHSGNFSTSCPNDATLVYIDSGLIDTIVNAHNIKRNFIAGGGDVKHSPACRMATMAWDDELATIAALNVKQCNLAHDSCRNTNAFRYSGQNLAWISFFGKANDGLMFQRAVDMWFAEVEHSEMEYIKSYPMNYKGPVIGHFTVMAADRNIHVGCAAATYSVKGTVYKAYLIACNYATTNIVNFPIYVECENAATSCRTGVNINYPNLCSTSEIYAVNEWF